MEKRETIVRLLRARTLNLYKVHGLCCSESVILVMNQGFGGGLAPEVAVRLGSGFCGGMGGDGVCGGLGGAMVALGLFLGPGSDAFPGKRKFRRLSRRLHDEFIARAGSSICGKLVQPFVADRRGRAENCVGLTGIGAELVCRIVLDVCPGLMDSCDFDFLSGQDGRLAVVRQRLMGRKSYAPHT